MFSQLAGRSSEGYNVGKEYGRGVVIIRYVSLTQERHIQGIALRSVRYIASGT